MVDRSGVDNGGSQAGAGFNYQWHIAANSCLTMLSDNKIIRIINEFEDDLQIVWKTSEVEYIQIKKKENGPWSFQDIIKPAKKQKLGILGKLVTPIQNGKKVYRLGLMGCGGIAAEKKNDCSLAKFIDLLQVPIAERDAGWHQKKTIFRGFLADQLSSQDIDIETIEKAIDILNIDLNFHSPDSIELENISRLIQITQRIWEVSLTFEAARRIYHEIFMRVKNAAISTSKSWGEKAINRSDIYDLVDSGITYPYPTLNQQHTLTLQDKLSSVGLGDRHQYALELRTKAIGLKYELDLPASVWEDFKTNIHLSWSSYRADHSQTKGIELWRALRSILKQVGCEWQKSYDDSRLDTEFAEGVFFDMAGICIAHFRKE
ncbi:MAG TPA: dsDNA nuclease domain-containing protein [Bellilinea sp.]|nr:dsDNA nuclease domain-containing protein [Bellilinea sp.]